MSLKSLSSGNKGHARESKGIKKITGIVFQTKIIIPQEYIALFIRNGYHNFYIPLAHLLYYLTLFYQCFIDM